MSSYHSSFTYLDINTIKEGFVITSFDADNGEHDTFLGMNQITTDSYDGTKKFFYGNRYNNTPTISITIMKQDGTDFFVSDNRRVFKWLSGYRQASWLDLYEGDNLVYSFYGSFTAMYQQKLDARIIGIRLEFTSRYPWAFSSTRSFDCFIGENILVTDSNGVLYKGENYSIFGITDTGIVFNDETNQEMTFSITSDGVIYNDIMVDLLIDNDTDDMYSYINLDMEYVNKTATVLTINNMTLEEKTVITDMKANENILISAGQFIISDIPNKIFGDTFNFVWPRLRPGKNKIVIDANGKGRIRFSYRYPIKIGDCALDLENILGEYSCGYCTVDKLDLTTMLEEVLAK